MKTILFTLALFSMNSFALDLESQLVACQKKVAKYYKYNGSVSDWPKEIRGGSVLLAGEALLDLSKNPVTTFSEDKLVYEGHGSYYSGYFIEAVVVNPKTCWVEETFGLYSE